MEAMKIYLNGKELPTFTNGAVNTSSTVWVNVDLPKATWLDKLPKSWWLFWWRLTGKLGKCE